jgi:hypothetical protein
MKPKAAVAPKVRYSTAQGATLGTQSTNDLALKGRYSDDPHHLLAIANSWRFGGVPPRWGREFRWGGLPRAALRLPWAMEYDPFGVGNGGSLTRG